MHIDERINISKMFSVVYVEPPINGEKHTQFATNENSYELIYKVSGDTITSFNGKQLHNTPGTIEYLPKCSVSDYYVDRIAPGDCIDIFFDTDCCMPSEAFVINATTNPNIHNLFFKIYHIWIEKKRGYYHKCMALFYEILFELDKPVGNYIPKDKYEKIAKGIEYLNTHYLDQNIDYFMPAHESGISYTYFKKLFVQKFEITPVQYITKLKIERACELLSTKLYSITEIAKICGFDTVYYFSSVFKKHMGTSPTKYISEHK